MRTIYAGEQLFIGRQGENNAAAVLFNVADWRRRYGNGTYAVLHKRCGDNAPYPAPVTVDGDNVRWVITSSDVEKPGFGEAELVLTVNGTVAISRMYCTVTEKSLGEPGEAPEPYESWVTQVLEAATAAEAASEAVQNMTVEGVPGEEVAVEKQVDPETGAVKLTFTLATGPTVTITEITGGHRITITDAKGDHEFDVMDGEGGDTAGVVAPAYSAEETYDEGDLVIRESMLYRAKQDITAPEAWKPAHWEQTTVDAELEQYMKYGTLVVTCLTQDGVTVTGQTVTVRKGDASGPVYAQEDYNGQPVSIPVPIGFDYYVSVSDTLDHHFNPTVAYGMVSTLTTNVTLTYSDLSNISTFGDIKAALNAGIDLSGLVGESVTATRQNRSLVFDVVDYDAVDESVWLLLHDTMPNQMVFEPKQALAWFADGLPAGSYYFTHSGENYYFTLTKPIPEDGQLAATTSTFSTYVNQDASTALESGSVSQTEIAGAASLGTTATGNLNHMNRVNSGSNNAGESGLFTWLNSDAEPNTNLPRVNKFSRPYSSGSDGGFLRGFDAADLECLEDVEWTIQANLTYEAPASMGGIAVVGQQYTITGKIGLAKLANVGLSGSSPWDLYVGATNADRIKYYNGGARSWWVFDTLPYVAGSEYVVYSSGGSSGSGTDSSFGVVPACKIKKDVV